MLYLLDTADVAAIARAVDLYPIAGVTTNPTLIARQKRPFADILRGVRAAIGPERMLHVQVTAAEAGVMVEEAERIRDVVGEVFHPKVPVTPQGMKAIRLLAAREFAVTATSILTAQQALMAAGAGAAFAAPYLNTLNNICGDGLKLVDDIAHLFRIHELSTRLLAASLVNVQQVHDVAMAGAHAATMPPEVMDLVLEHPLTTSAVARFTADWAAVYGAGTTAVDLLKS